MITKTLILFTLLMGLAHGEVIDLTEDDKEVERRKFIDDTNSGVRVQMGDMKEMNKKAGQGNVNIGIDHYETVEIENFDKEFQKEFPKVKLTIYKTDFKGYQFTCNKMPKCRDDIEKALSKRPREINLKGGYKLPLTIASGDSYKEVYIKARAMQNYAGYDGKNPDIFTFLNEKIQSIMVDESISKKQLKKDVAKVRRGDIKGISKKSFELMELIDTLEVPFQGANNLDKEFKGAIDGTSNTITLKNGMKISSAQSGDDLYIVIKNKFDDVLKIVGADARGLGVANMIARREAFIDHISKGKPINSIEDLAAISKKGIREADNMMYKSMDTYKKILIKDFEKFRVGQSIDEFLTDSNDRYIDLTSTDSNLMGMRAAAINKCGLQECFNNMTKQHNLLKELEQLNINNHFSSSCLGTQYWLKKVISDKKKYKFIRN